MPSRATAFFMSPASVRSGTTGLRTLRRPLAGSASRRLADAQVAAEGFDVDAPLAATHLGIEFAAGTVVVLADVAEIAAQVATEAAVVDRGRQVRGHLDLHVAAHAVDVDAALRGRTAVELHIAGHRAQIELLPGPAAGLDAPGDGLQVRLAAQCGSEDVAADGLQVGAFGMTGLLHGAAHAFDREVGRAGIDAHAAADRVDRDLAAVHAVDAQRRADHLHVQRGAPGHVQVEGAGAHRIVAMPVEPAAGTVVLGLDLDFQVAVVALDGQWRGAFAERAADLHFVAVPGRDGHLALDVAHADARVGRGGVMQVDRRIGQRLADAQGEHQGEVASGFHGWFLDGLLSLPA